MDHSQLILLAHGSRDPDWCRTFETGLTRINARLSRPARLAYMEMADPRLEAVIRQGYSEGCRRFRILPLFFASGRHLVHDVPSQLEALRAELPDARLELMDAVGEQPGFWVFLSYLVAGTEKLDRDARRASRQ